VAEQKSVEESKFKFEDLDLKPHRSQERDERHIMVEETEVDGLAEEHLKKKKKGEFLLLKILNLKEILRGLNPLPLRICFLAYNILVKDFFFFFDES
jgi:hypothetical protein